MATNFNEYGRTRLREEGGTNPPANRRPRKPRGGGDMLGPTPSNPVQPLPQPSPPPNLLGGRVAPLPQLLDGLITQPGSPLLPPTISPGGVPTPPGAAGGAGGIPPGATNTPGTLSTGILDGDAALKYWTPERMNAAMPMGPSPGANPGGVMAMLAGLTGGIPPMNGPGGVSPLPTPGPGPIGIGDYTKPIGEGWGGFNPGGKPYAPPGQIGGGAGGGPSVGTGGFSGAGNANPGAAGGRTTLPARPGITPPKPRSVVKPGGRTTLPAPTNPPTGGGRRQPNPAATQRFMQRRNDMNRQH